MSALIPINDDESQSADPEQEASRGRDARKERARRGQSAKPEIPDAEACLWALSQLPGLIAMGVLTSAQANAIRSTYQAILQHYRRSEDKHQQGKLADEDVLQVLRQSPGLMSMLEPLLTQAQIEMLMQQEADDDEDGHDGQA